jgi:hypothetical protein
LNPHILLIASSSGADVYQMDNASLSVKQFLEALQDGRSALSDASDVWRSKVPIAKPYLSFPSGTPFSLFRNLVSDRKFNGRICMGISVNKQPDCEYLNTETLEFEINLIWDEEKWYMITTAWEEFEDGRRRIRSFPERQAASLNDCLQQLELAINDLVACDDLLTKK